MKKKKKKKTIPLYFFYDLKWSVQQSRARFCVCVRGDRIMVPAASIEIYPSEPRDTHIQLTPGGGGTDPKPLG